MPVAANAEHLAWWNEVRAALAGRTVAQGQDWWDLTQDGTLTIVAFPDPEVTVTDDMVLCGPRFPSVSMCDEFPAGGIDVTAVAVTNLRYCRPSGARLEFASCPTVVWSWSFTDDLLDDQTAEYPWEGATTFLDPGARWSWTGSAQVTAYDAFTALVDPATDYQIAVNVDSRTGSGTRQLNVVWKNSANSAIRTDVLHADLPAGNHVLSPPTTPSGTVGFTIQCLSSGTAHLFVSYVAVLQPTG